MAENLRVKEVAVAPGGAGDGDDGARTNRFVVCHNAEQAQRYQTVRGQLVSHLEQLIDGSDAWPGSRRSELVGSLKTKPGLPRYLRRRRVPLEALRPCEHWGTTGLAPLGKHRPGRPVPRGSPAAPQRRYSTHTFGSA